MKNKFPLWERERERGTIIFIFSTCAINLLLNLMVHLYCENLERDLMYNNGETAVLTISSVCPAPK